MLRTHGELGYRQEQRFHLELGLLKMAHAQKLLPLEQLLSNVAVPATAPRSAGKPTVVPSVARTETPAARSNYVSPFSADSARKSGSGKPQMSAENPAAPGPRIVSTPATPVVMGSAAPATVSQPAPSVPPPVAHVEVEDPRPGPEVTPEAEPSAQSERLRLAVLKALSEAGQRLVANMLETGEWKVEGNEVVIKVASSQAVIDMSFGADAKRILIATASGFLGRPVKAKVLPGGTAQKVTTAPASNGGGRTRAEQDPIVQKMKEKFGAEIRTIIDYKEKR
jgi:DNA polymerase-3 subunit gamma/tau